MTDSGPMFSGITTFVDNSGFTFGVGGGTSIFTPATNVLTFGTNNTEKVRIDANGNANITGVTTSTNFKTGSSNLHSTGLTVGNNFLHSTGINVGTGATIHVPATNTLTLGTNSAERLRISSNGLVNIGAGSSASGLSPLLHLHKNASNSSAYFHITNNDTGITNNDGFLLGVNPSGDCLVFNKDSTPMRFATAGLERLRITSAGDVGIGVNDPDAKLEVLEDIFVKGSSGDGDTGIQIRSGSSALSNQHQIRTGGGNGNMLFLEAVGGTGIIAMKTAGSERLRIDSQGRLLLGGTFSRGQDDADNLTIDGSGEGTGRTGITIRSASNTFGSIFFSDATSGDAQYDGVVAYDHSSSTMRFSTNSMQRVFINSSHSSSTNAIMGVGTIPQTAQYSGYDILQVGETASIFSNNTSGDTNITTIANNLYLDATASSWKYLKTDEASRYQQDTGCHRFYSIASGSAGANCSPKQLAAFENNATGLASLAYGNRPQYKGQLVLFGQSYETENGGIEFHSSGGGGAGYGARITCYSDGAIRFLGRNNNSAWTKTFRMLANGSFEYGDSPTSSLWTATDANGAHYRRSEGSHQFANKATTGYSVIYCNKNTGSGTGDTRYIAFYWNGSQIGYINYNSGVIQYYTGSDHRLKENITDVADGISIVKQLKPKNFNFINDENKTTHSGFLAHEVQEVLPSLVNGVKDEVVTQESVDAGTQPEDSKAGDPIYQGLDYGKFTPILTKALQELITKVETLEQENIALRERVTNLEGN